MMAEGFNPQEIEAFHRDGFIILRDVFSQDEIKQLREAILAGPSSNEPGRPCRNAAFTWRVPQAFLEHDILLEIGRAHV